MDNWKDAKIYSNGLLNVKDSKGVTQTYFITTGGYMWRDYEGQYGVKKTEGSFSDFWKRLSD